MAALTKLTKVEAFKLVRRFEALGLGFPRTNEGLEALTEAFIAIVGTQDIENALWLSQQVLYGCSRCPTPIELRRIYSAKRGEPADGKHERDFDNADYMVSMGNAKDK